MGRDPPVATHPGGRPTQRDPPGWVAIFFYPPNEIKHSSDFLMIFHDFSKPKNRKMTKKINNNIGPFSRGGLEKPNPARTIDTLADGS